MFKRIAEWLILTKTERNVILFLAITMLAGAGIRLYQVTFASVPQFDYHASDSTFASLSNSADNGNALSESETNEEIIGKLNINTATKQQLMDLPGIGEATAERILTYRSEKGKFSSVEELLEVKGISAKKLEKLKPLIIIQ